jgi:hypothetical protein
MYVLSHSESKEDDESPLQVTCVASLMTLMTLSPWNSSNSCRKSSLLFLFPLNIVGTTPHSLSVSCRPPAPPAPAPAPAPGGGEGDWCGGC